jgi:hypothetical protein
MQKNVTLVHLVQVEHLNVHHVKMEHIQPIMEQLLVMIVLKDTCVHIQTRYLSYVQQALTTILPNKLAVVRVHVASMPKPKGCFNVLIVNLATSANHSRSYLAKKKVSLKNDER